MFSNLEKTEILALVVLVLVIIVEIIFLISAIFNLDRDVQTQREKNQNNSFVTDIAESVLSDLNSTSSQENIQQQDTENKESTSESLSYVNCGSINNNKSDSDIQEISDCFDNRFNSCLPARIEFNLNTLSQDISYFFQIEGASKGRCIVNQGYTDHPASELEETMTCRYLSSEDQSILGDQSADDVEVLSGSQGLQELNENQCSGPLYDSLRDLLVSSQSPNPNCSLSVNVLDIKLPVNTGFSVSASGFKGSENEVLWAVEDESIASLSSDSGSSVQVIKNSAGDTRVLVIDSSIEDCQIAIDVRDI